VIYPRKVRLSELVNSLKGVSSRRLKIEFPAISTFCSARNSQDVLWSPSYFVGWVGGAPIEILRLRTKGALNPGVNAWPSAVSGRRPDGISPDLPCSSAPGMSWSPSRLGAGQVAATISWDRITQGRSALANDKMRALLLEVLRGALPI
jgi:hypothetical protein